MTWMKYRKSFGKNGIFRIVQVPLMANIIRIFSPKNSGSLFCNNKDFFSIVLLAIVDANCKFIYVDIGSYGKEGDNGIFTKSKILEKNEKL